MSPAASVAFLPYPSARATCALRPSPCGRCSENQTRKDTCASALADVVIDAVDAAFQRCKTAFNRIRGNADAVLIADVFSGLVIHLIVLTILESAR